MENEKIARINEFLVRHGASIKTIPKQKVTQFEKVDEAIQARLAEINKAQEILRGKPINVSVIAQDTGISRKTFYNNDLLRLYVEEHSPMLDTKNASEDDVERLRAKCEELEQQIRLFLLRDLETENLRHENMKLQIEIQNVQARNTSLEEQYERLQERYEELQKNVETVPKVIHLNRDNKK